MKSLELLTTSVTSISTPIAWYLADLGEAKGKQQMFTRQSPQALKALREHALIESAISSNRIEGVEIDASRVREVLLGKPTLKDRNEEEVRGYREALKVIHEHSGDLLVTQETIRDLHRLSRGEIWDAGKYKEKDVDIIEFFPGGGSRIRFKTVPAKRTAAAVKELIVVSAEIGRNKSLHPLIALGGV